jgi:hypothetical protein
VNQQEVRQIIQRQMNVMSADLANGNRDIKKCSVLKSANLPSNSLLERCFGCTFLGCDKTELTTVDTAVDDLKV